MLVMGGPPSRLWHVGVEQQRHAPDEGDQT
jgi:hypothetical protein